MPQFVFFVVCSLVFMSSALGSADFDAGADLRVRQEMLDHVPGLPGGGVWLNAKEMRYRNQLRFRPRVWAEESLVSDIGKFRLRLRLTDEFRHYVHTSSKVKYRWPDEVIIDNLFIEGRDLADGFIDFRLGRLDIHGLYGLDYVFDDGTPGDASRTFYGDMATVTLNFTKDSTLDFFGIYNRDDNVLRWGTDDDKHRPLTGLGGGAEPEMDDWGFGAIWGSKLAKWLPYQVYVMQKNTLEFERKGEVHPWTQRELLGTKLMPQLDDEWSLHLEGMGQVGCNGEGATLTGWFAYSGVKWKSARKSTVRPFASLGYKFMSGDDDAADEDGGHSAWDPMWGRGIADSLLFAYGTNYGVQWWSNVQVASLTAGLDLGRRHRVSANCGPMFAAAQDGLGGGEGMYKGLLSWAKYEFPIWLPNHEQGERLEVFGHLLAELFNPGDYYEAEKAAWFLRWQVEFRF